MFLADPQSFGNPGAGVRNEGTFDAPWDNGEYGWAIPQLYGEVAMGYLTTKVGHFFTPVGYEVIPATGNFFYTHSYTFFNSEPFTHTGMLSTYTGIEGSRSTAAGRSAGTPASISSTVATTGSAAFQPSSRKAPPSPTSPPTATSAGATAAATTATTTASCST